MESKKDDNLNLGSEVSLETSSESISSCYSTDSCNSCDIICQRCGLCRRVF